MKRLLALALLVGLLIPEGAMAARWHVRTVTVYDQTSSIWDGDVIEGVEDMNAMRPRREPRFVYKEEPPEVPCDEVTARRRAIIVCSADDIGGNAAGGTAITLDGDGIWGVVIQLSNTHRRDEAGRIVCHEFMHATTGIGDNSVYDPETGIRTYPYPDTSCVWGVLPDPGSFDYQYAGHVYRGRDKGKHRHR